MKTNLTVNQDAYLNYSNANAKLISAMGNNFPDPASFRSAIKFYDKAIEYDSSFANAYARRAIALSWAIHYGEFDTTECSKCFSDIDTASKIDGKLPDVKIAWGFYHYYCKKDYETAELRFEEAYNSDPDDYEPLFYLMMVYRTSCKWEEMKNILDRIIKFDICDPLVLTNIGICYDYRHDFDTAIVYHNKAIHAVPDWLPPYLNKINSYCFRDGNTIEFHLLLDFVTRNLPGRFEELKINLDIYDRNYFEALDKALNAYSEDFSCKGGRFIYLGNISRLMNDQTNADKYFDDAIVELNQFLCQNPIDPVILSYLGLALAGKRDPEGKKEGQKALDYSKDSRNCPLESEMRVNLAEIYTKLEMFPEATEQIEYLLDNPSYFSEKMLFLDPVWEPLLQYSGFNKVITRSNRVLTF